MKHLIILSLATMATCLAGAKSTPQMASEGKKSSKPESVAMSPDQQAALKEQRIARGHEKAGGMIRDERNMAGKIRIVNAQTRVPACELRKPMETIAKFLKIQMDIVDDNFVSRKEAYSYRQKNKVNAVIVVCDEANDDTILVAPEKRWASVNVAPLAATNIPTRAQKELSRAIAYVCGGISSQYPGNLAMQFDSADALDGIDTYQLPIDVLMGMKNNLGKLGVSPYRNVIYRKACIEGWAPAPTNAIQKAIWDKVHAAPDKPIKITYDKDKQKPVVK